jgi:hypothetical protein
MFLPSIEKETQGCGKEERTKEGIMWTSMYAQDKGSHWYIHIGCSKHMTEDRNKFLIIKEEKGGNVTFLMLLEG